MTRIAVLTVCVGGLAMAMACSPVGPETGGGARPDFNTMGLGDDDSRPDPAGGCYATERTPAVYEQVPGQVLVVPEVRAEDGTLVRAPIYRNATVPKLVRPREEVRFPAPCPPTFTPDFIATLQRALVARGYYGGAVTERLDPPTRAAIAAFQRERGLDSDKLALNTARELGLVAVEVDGATPDRQAPAG
ncbi:Putative peptidoglycan binding domain protein [Roseivivax sp. THAF40]|uniref:peptidoglycan-binding domain-containing protein n=1 Tax=unclassified Roseivivax TaxID=2639302 RepID=UPI0012A819B1|nr:MULTISPECIES: peptidoglycan-binding domain-containing protein [unclassified Roseivivax]QFS82055.1 Putative peptidoglycan binding domain protein [Roseivivax sp. THAF197b]QFT45855.1 Putative peptidoglycan binding domain protein [Roseivivax sp. THAF40]